jgi:hypothetical protein
VAYYRAPAAKSSPHTSKDELLVAVGWHAFVNWPQKAGERATSVPLALPDRDRDPATNDLSDGQEVEILAWRPFASGGLSYQIRRLSDGNEFWVRALYLRKKKEAPRQA